jgi:hypothetical protein
MNLVKKLSNLNVFQRLFSNSSNLDVIYRRAALFDEEKNRQLSEIERIDKIEVKVVEPGKECILMMNKYISTPFNCALREFYFSLIIQTYRIDFLLFDTCQCIGT